MAKRGDKALDDGKGLEERIKKLELIGEAIRKPDIPMDEAIKYFEEGIVLSRSLEKELAKLQNRIEMLTNEPEAPAEEPPELELFDLGQ